MVCFRPEKRRNCGKEAGRSRSRPGGAGVQGGAYRPVFPQLHARFAGALYEAGRARIAVDRDGEGDRRPSRPPSLSALQRLSSPKIPWWTMRRYACCRLPPSIIPHGPGRREKPAMHIMGNPDMVGSPVRPEVRAEEAKSDCPGSCAIDTAAARPGEGFVFRRHASSFNLVHLAGHVFSTRTTPCDRRCSWRVTFPATAAQGRRLTASI